MDSNVFGQTDIGKVRDNNEDAFIAEDIQGNYILGCVIDGVGGYEGGEVAAAIAKERIRENLGTAGIDQPLQRMADTVKQANEEIYNRKQEVEGLDKMSCVLTMVYVDLNRNKLYYAHVGDTRLYLLRDGSLVKITSDHSFVGFLEDSGRLTESAAMTHPKRNEINQALGFTPTSQLKENFVETGESPFLPGDVLLICSDGLTDRIDKEKMTNVLMTHSSLAKATSLLIEGANDAGGQDNITVVLIRNNNRSAEPSVAAPAAKVNAAAPPSEQPAWQEPVTAPITRPKVKKNRGWIIFLLLVIVVLSGCVAYLYLQVMELQKPGRKMAPVYENPWEPLPASPQDTIKIPLKDSTIQVKDTVAKKSVVNGTNSSQ